MKTYLGDAVYVERTVFGDVLLTTSDGARDTNRIVLEPSVLEAFQEWIDATFGERL